MADPTMSPDLILPNTSSFINPAYATPAQRAQLYAYANELMKPQEVKNGWQGIGELARALIGGYSGYRADQMEQASRAYDAQLAAKAAGAAYSPGPPGAAPMPTQTAAPSAAPSPAIAPSGASPAASDSSDAGTPSPGDVMAYTASSAAARGIDPRAATAMFNGESSGNIAATGDGQSSFGPAQLHYGGISKAAPHAGLGDDFTAATGMDARNPSTWKAQIDFALDNAKKTGWAPWATTRDKLGFNNYTGIGPAPSAGAPAAAAINNVAPPPGVNPASRAMGTALLGGGAPIRVAQNGNGMPVSAATIGQFLADPNLPESVKHQVMETIAPRTMTDATGNASISYQNQPPAAPIFQGGVRGPDIGGVPQVITGTPNAPRSVLVPPGVAGQGAPAASAPAQPPVAGAMPNVRGPGSAISDLAVQQAETDAQTKIIGDKTAANTARYQRTIDTVPQLQQASYPLRQLQAILEQNGGNLPTGEGAANVMSTASLGNMISTMLGHPIAQEDSKLTQMELLRKYGNQIAMSLTGRNTDLGSEQASTVSPGEHISQPANIHLVDNYIRLNQLAQKKAQFEHDYFLAHSGNPAAAYDNFNEDWNRAISGPNAVPLSKFGRAVKLRDGSPGVYVPSTDPSGFSLFPANAPEFQPSVMTPGAK